MLAVLLFGYSYGRLWSPSLWTDSAWLIPRDRDCTWFQRAGANPKLLRQKRANPRLSWGFAGFGRGCCGYAAGWGVGAAGRGMGAPSRWKARRWSGVAWVSIGISVLVWW